MTTSILQIESRDKDLLETSWKEQHDRRTTIKVCTYLLSDQCEDILGH